MPKRWVIALVLACVIVAVVFGVVTFMATQSTVHGNPVTPPGPTSVGAAGWAAILLGAVTAALVAVWRRRRRRTR